MREWLSGGAPPCQGGGRGFDPRLALLKQTKGHPRGCPFCLFRGTAVPRSSIVSASLRSAQGRGPPDLVRRLALFFISRKRLPKLTKMGVKPSAGNDRWHPSSVMSILQNKKYKGNAEVEIQLSNYRESLILFFIML